MEEKNLAMEITIREIISLENHRARVNIDGLTVNSIEEIFMKG